MIASTFQPKPDPEFGFLKKTASMALLYGLMWPLSKILTPLNRWPPFPNNNTTHAKAAEDYRPSADDVFVCSYFKSGTTWQMQVVTQIAFRGQADFDNIHHVVPWLGMPHVFEGRMIPMEDHSTSQLSPTGLRAIKAHFPYAMMPKSPEARYIAMVRDPKGVAVSGYHFIKALALGPTMPPFPAWVRKFLSPDFFEGTWASHLAGYWEHRNDPNVLFLVYDDLLADLGAGIDRIADFMGVELTTEERAAVIERSSFASMKREAAKFEPGKSLAWAKDEAMVRKGGAGTADKLMTPEIARQIDDHCRAELRKLGCDFDYDAAFCRKS